jgi:hypothetical protein
MRKEHFIIIMFKFELEGKGVVETASLLFHTVLVVADVLTVSLPAKARFTFRLFLRIDERSHSLIVRTLWLNEVDDVELVSYSFSIVADLEVVPLSIVVSTIVVLKDEVIFEFTNLDSSSQIATLESALKNESIV